MKHLRLLALTSSALFAAYGGLVACSDDTVVTDPPAEGGTTDSPADNFVPDSGTPDVNNSPDAETAPQFAQRLGAAMCQALARCCYGNGNLAEDGGIPDGGNYKKASCENFWRNLGFEGSNLNVMTTDAGAVNVNAVQGNDCIAKVNALTCNLGGAELTAVRNSCFAVLSGKANAGATCTSPLDCGPGSFCRYNDAGTGGTCTTLRPDGGACGDFLDHIASNDTAIAPAEEACSYRRGGLTNLHCDNYDYVGGAYRARTDWKCVPRVAAGGRCNYSNWCTNEVCNGDPNYTCVPSLDYFGGFCKNFR